MKIITLLASAFVLTESIRDCIDFPDSELTRDFIKFLDSKMNDLVNEFFIKDYFVKFANVHARSLNEDENEIVSKVVNSFSEVIKEIENNRLSSVEIQNIFSKIFEGIKNLLPEFEESTTNETSDGVNENEEEYTFDELGYNDGLSYFAEWPNVCHMIWYPYHKEKCGEARCLACAPAMMASAQVCRQTEGRVTSNCIKQMLRGGFCNFCIRKYVQN